MWQPAIRGSHESFKTVLPHGDQVPCIETQAFGVFQKKKKYEHEKQKRLLKDTTDQMCLR